MDLGLPFFYLGSSRSRDTKRIARIIASDTIRQVSAIGSCWDTSSRRFLRRKEGSSVMESKPVDRRVFVARARPSAVFRVVVIRQR